MLPSRVYSTFARKGPTILRIFYSSCVGSSMGSSAPFPQLLALGPQGHPRWFRRGLSWRKVWGNSGVRFSVCCLWSFKSNVFQISGTISGMWSPCRRTNSDSFCWERSSRLRWSPCHSWRSSIYPEGFGDAGFWLRGPKADGWCTVSFFLWWISPFPRPQSWASVPPAPALLKPGGVPREMSLLLFGNDKTTPKALLFYSCSPHRPHIWIMFQKSSGWIFLIGLHCGNNQLYQESARREMHFGYLEGFSYGFTYTVLKEE